MYWRLQFAKKNLHITGIRKVFFCLEPPQECITLCKQYSVSMMLFFFILACTYFEGPCLLIMQYMDE